MSIALMYILTTLVPIHGAFFLGIRWENEKRRALLRSLWNIRHGGKK
jgi:hypothetical protein